MSQGYTGLSLIDVLFLVTNLLIKQNNLSIGPASFKVLFSFSGALQTEEFACRHEF